MIKTIKDFFSAHVSNDAGETGQHSQNALHIAAAALLIEMTRADCDVKDEELRAVADSVKQIFGLSQENANQLLKLAGKKADGAVSDYEFTSLINKEFNPQEKIQLIEMMWQVAYSDNHLEMYEEAFVRKIAELIYVPHQDFIAAKHRVLNRQG